MPTSHPDFRKLLRQLRDNLVDKAVTAPSLARAEALMHLAILDMEARAYTSRNRYKSKTQKSVATTDKILSRAKRRSRKSVTQLEDDHGLGDPPRKNIHVSELPGSDDGEGATPVSGPGLCGGHAGDAAEGTPAEASLSPGAGSSGTAA